MKQSKPDQIFWWISKNSEGLFNFVKISSLNIYLSIGHFGKWSQYSPMGILHHSVVIDKLYCTPIQLSPSQFSTSKQADDNYQYV